MKRDQGDDQGIDQGTRVLIHEINDQGTRVLIETSISCNFYNHFGWVKFFSKMGSVMQKLSFKY